MGLEQIDVQLRDGVCIQAPGIQQVTADATYSEYNLNILSHAHGDHLFNDAEGSVEIVCSPLTAALAAERRDLKEISPVNHESIELHPSGHIAGSRASLIETEVGTVLYTGDLATRDRYYLDGFEPLPADVLIIESTYGKPEYEFPPHEEVEKKALEWLSSNYDKPAILFGYALGKAQKIQELVSKSDRDRLFATEAILNMNAIVSQHKDVEFAPKEYTSEIELGTGDVVILPSGLGQFEWVETIVENNDAVTAGFSGWAHEQSFIYRRNLDAGFVLSDHCDFPELISVVEDVDPEVVYTQHGYSSEFAQELVKRGFDAQALQNNQTALGDFA